MARTWHIEFAQRREDGAIAKGWRSSQRLLTKTENSITMATPDLMNRGDLLQTTLYCGGLYALWRIALTVCYPLVSGSLWQNVIGPHHNAKFFDADAKEVVLANLRACSPESRYDAKELFWQAE
jgi:hypothetical protein